MTNTEKQLVSDNNGFAFNLFRTAQNNGSYLLHRKIHGEIDQTPNPNEKPLPNLNLTAVFV